MTKDLCDCTISKRVGSGYPTLLLIAGQCHLRSADIRLLHYLLLWMWFGTVYGQTTDICYPDICAEGSSKHYTAWQLHIPLGDLSSSVTDERVPSNVYLRALFCLLVAKEDRVFHCTFYLQNCTVHRHGYEDVTLHTINTQEQTILQNSPYIYPHVQSPAMGWSYLPIITWSLIPPNSSPANTDDVRRHIWFSYRYRNVQHRPYPTTTTSLPQLPQRTASRLKRVERVGIAAAAAGQADVDDVLSAITHRRHPSSRLIVRLLIVSPATERPVPSRLSVSIVSVPPCATMPSPILSVRLTKLSEQTRWTDCASHRDMKVTAHLGCSLMRG